MIRSRENRTFRSLKKLARSGRERRRCGRVLLEGRRLVESCLRQGGRVSTVVLAGGSGNAGALKGLASRVAGAEVIVLADRLFRELSAFASPSGVLALVELPAFAAKDGEGDALYLDGIQDPGNLGMILRSAAASGTGTVFLSPQCADPWSPKVLRAGMGAQFKVRVRVERDLAAAAARFRGEVVALEAGAETTLFDKDLTRRTALVVGSEGSGVSPALLAVANDRVSIPMPGWNEPLNAAAAATVSLFELVRQRLERRRTAEGG